MEENLKIPGEYYKQKMASKEGGCPVKHHTVEKRECPDGKCPVDHSNTKTANHGDSAVGSCPVTHIKKGCADGTCPVKSQQGECPVQHNNPFLHTQKMIAEKQKEQASTISSTTTKPTRDGLQIYNPAANDMTFSSKVEFNDQTVRLDTHRTVSTIPKSDFTPGHQPKDEQNWIYPSGNSDVR